MTLVVVVACGLGADEQSVSDNGALLERCRVTLIEDVEVPAQEAGQIVAIEAREGMLVEMMREDGALRTG